MLLFSRKSARMEKHDFVYRGEFETTYSAVGWTLGRGKDCFSFRVWQTRESRPPFDLKMLVTVL